MLIDFANLFLARNQNQFSKLTCEQILKYSAGLAESSKILPLSGTPETEQLDSTNQTAAEMELESLKASEKLIDLSIEKEERLADQIKSMDHEILKAATHGVVAKEKAC